MKYKKTVKGRKENVRNDEKEICFEKERERKKTTT
jgi:hypothetical protein